MKQAKKPTRVQKETMAKYGLDWSEWNVSMEDNTYLVVWHKKKGYQRVLEKNKKPIKSAN